MELGYGTDSKQDVHPEKECFQWKLSVQEVTLECLQATLEWDWAHLTSLVTEGVSLSVVTGTSEGITSEGLEVGKNQGNQYSYQDWDSWLSEGLCLQESMVCG